MTKNIQGPCQHCGMPIEFAAAAIGTTTKCPYCRKPTELQLGTPKAEPAIPRKAIVLSVVAALILGLGLLGAWAALRRAEKLAAEKKATATHTNTAPVSNGARR